MPLRRCRPGLLDPGTLARGVRSSLPVGHRVLHGRRGRELRAPLSGVLPATAPGLRPRRGVSPLSRLARPRLGRLLVELWSGASCRARRRSGTASLRRLDDDDDRLRERRLQPLAAAGRVVIVALDVRRRLCGLDGGSVKVVRHLVLGRILGSELDQTVHPELMSRVHLYGRPVDERSCGRSRLRPALRRRLRRRDAPSRHRCRAAGLGLPPLDAVAAAATTLGNVGPRVRFRGPDGLASTRSATSRRS